MINRNFEYNLFKSILVNIYKFRYGNKKYTTEKFTEKANKIHNGKYSYDKVVYTLSKNKVIITCKVHGDFEQNPTDHLIGKGCLKCSGNIKNTTEDFIEKSNKVHNGLYIYNKADYINATSKVTITCRIHGDFEQTPNNHLRGKGCAKCNNRCYSKKAISWLNYIAKTQNLLICHAKNGGEFLIPETKFKADGYCKETNTIYEFYGDFWHGNPNCFSGIDYNRVNKCTYEELYQETLKREQQIRDLGYNLVTIWESDWDRQEKLIAA